MGSNDAEVNLSSAKNDSRQLIDGIGMHLATETKYLGFTHRRPNFHQPLIQESFSLIKKVESLANSSFSLLVCMLKDLLRYKSQRVHLVFSIRQAIW